MSQQKFRIIHAVFSSRGLLWGAGLMTGLAVGLAAGRMGWGGGGANLVMHGAAGGGLTDYYQPLDPLVDVRMQILHNYVEPVDDKKIIRGAIDGMLSELDPYSNYFSKEEWEAFDKQTHGQFSGIGAELSQDPQTGRLKVISPIEDSPALKAGMLAGDTILKVNGENLEGLSLKDLITRISGVPGTEVKITVLHEGEKTPVELTIKRAVISVHSVKGCKISENGWSYLIDPEHRIAYVRITTFMESTAEDLDKALLPLINSEQGLRGIILDLRFNPGGLLTEGIGVADRFLESGVIVTTRGRDGSNQFKAEAKKAGTYPRIPLVVLVNEYSASASEIVAGALYDQKRAVLIGARTYGKGSVQNLIALDGGNAALKLTTAHYYLPSGRYITRQKDAKTWGVEPDPAFLIPLTKEENVILLQQRMDSEIIRNKATTAPATQPANTTAPADGLVDKQLQRGLEVLLAFQSFSGAAAGGESEVVTTRPMVSATLNAPATRPTTKP